MHKTVLIHDGVATVHMSAELLEAPPVPIVVYEARDTDGRVALRIQHPVDLGEPVALPSLAAGTEWVRVAY